MAKRRTFRLSDETEKMLLELKEVYQAKSENHLLELLVRDIYNLKKSKALVPYEELDKRDKELKMAFLKVGELQGTLQEKGKTITELKNNIEIRKEEKENKKGFWAKLFGL